MSTPRKITPLHAARVVAHLGHTLPERPAPFNLEAEQALLGAMFIDNAAFHKVASFLRPAHFYDPLHARIYETIAAIIEAGKVATPVTAKTYFENSEPIDPQTTVPQYLGRLAANATTTTNARDYGETIADLAARRSLIVQAEDMLAVAYESDVSATPGAQIDAAMQRLTSLKSDWQKANQKFVDGLEFACDARIASAGPYLIKHLLSAGSVAALYGPSGCGKTFYALDLCFHVALGIPWRGRRVTRAPVLYVALEGQLDFPKRVLATARALGEPGKKFARLRKHISLVAGSDGEAGVAAIVDAAAQLSKANDEPTGLVVIDTLARAMGGENENEAQAMSGVLSKVARIQQETGAAVLLIHHPGKEEARGMRGSSALFAAMDLVVKIDRREKDATRSVTVEKAKDGIEGQIESYTLATVDLGRDQDGDDITSCVICPETFSSAKSSRLPKPGTGEAKALGELHELIIAGKFALADGSQERIPRGAKVVSVDVFRTACHDKGLSATRSADAEKQAFGRARRDLEAHGIIGVYGDSVWLIDRNQSN